MLVSPGAVTDDVTLFTPKKVTIFLVVVTTPTLSSFPWSLVQCSCKFTPKYFHLGVTPGWCHPGRSAPPAYATANGVVSLPHLSAIRWITRVAYWLLTVKLLAYRLHWNAKYERHLTGLVYFTLLRTVYSHWKTEKTTTTKQKLHKLLCTDTQRDYSCSNTIMSMFNVLMFCAQ